MVYGSLHLRREYYKRIDPLSFYTARKFQQRYRLSKPVTRILLRNYVSAQHKKRFRGKHAVPHRIRFCIALRYLATGATYTSVGDCHGVSKSVVCESVKSVTDFFHRHITEYVKWPDSKTDENNNSMPFYQRRKKPKCFGLVDGTHVPIGCPRGATRDENQYYCYKGYYSINTMIVCDYFGIIFHVDASNPGSCNDIYCMNGSQIKYLGDRQDFSGYYLLGDSGYVLTDWLLTPVKVEHTRAEHDYNKWHRKTRSQVERTIGILKQRWRCLDSSGGYLMHDPERAGAIIETCVCLHNCATVGKVRLLRDFPQKDSFRPVQARIAQPGPCLTQERAKFANMRKDFIQEHFLPKVRRRVAPQPLPGVRRRTTHPH